LGGVVLKLSDKYTRRVQLVCVLSVYPVSSVDWI